MQFEAEVKSGGFRVKTLKDGPPVLVREVKLLIDSSARCLDEISAMTNQVVRVQLDKIQLSFGDGPGNVQLETQSDKPPERPAKIKRIRRKSVLKE